jgi:flagellar assembly protein FliH
MTSTRRFLFDTEFDADVARRREERLAAEALTPRAPPPPPEPEEPPPPPEPVFKSADLLQAHEDGYADGFATGKAAAEAAAAARVSATLERLADQLEYIVQSAADTAARQREGVIRIGAAISRKLLPDLSRRQGTTEAEAMLGAVITELIDEPRMVIRVADDDLDTISEKIDTIATRRGFAGKIVLLAEPSVASGDCRIEWADGGVERDSARLWHDIDLAVARLLGGGEDHDQEHGHAPDGQRHGASS